MKTTSTLPLLLASVVGGFAAIVIVWWLAVTDDRSFRREEQALMAESAAQAADYVRDFVEQRKVLVRAFAQRESALLARMVRDPEDEAPQVEARALVGSFFPQHFAFIARRSDGEFVPDEFGKFVGGACRSDMDEFATLVGNADAGADGGHGADVDYEPLIHPQPFHYHFDITATWTAPDGTRGLLMISFPPVALVRILAAHQLPEHRLMLLRRDVGDLIEVTSLGWRENIDRDGRLTPAELSAIAVRTPVSGTRWDAAYLPSTAYLDGYRDKTYRSAGLITLLILAFVGVTTWWYVVSERARHRAAQQEARLLRRSNRDRTALQTLIDVIPMPIFRRSRDGQINLLNEAYANLLGLPVDDLLGKNIAEIYAAETAGVIRERDEELLRHPGTRQTYERHVSPINGTVGRDVIFHKTSVLLEGDEEPSIVGAAVDVTEEKALRAELEKLATTDPLTGVANRRRFMSHLETELRRARRYGSSVSLVMLDIDHFKSVNDRFGHDVGDEAIKAVANALQTEVRKSLDLPARIGGEEFAIILPETDVEGGLAFAERVRRIVEAMPIVCRDQTISVTVSLGVSASRDDDRGAGSELVSRVDQALYESKNRGRNRSTVFTAVEEATEEAPST